MDISYFQKEPVLISVRQDIPDDALKSIGEFKIKSAWQWYGLVYNCFDSLVFYDIRSYEKIDAVVLYRVSFTDIFDGTAKSSCAGDQGCH